MQDLNLNPAFCEAKHIIHGFPDPYSIMKYNPKSQPPNHTNKRDSLFPKIFCINFSDHYSIYNEYNYHRRKRDNK